MATHEKSTFLFAMMEPQSVSARLMFSAHALKTQGRIHEAEVAYQQLEAALRTLLEITEAHNAEYPDSPMEVEPIFGQLVNAITTRADLLEALGDRSAAGALRTEALHLSAGHLPGTSVAEHKRQVAAALAAESRYHEAIAALIEARAALEQAGNRLRIAQVGAQMAEIYEWLGDRQRAHEEASRAIDFLEPMLPAGEPEMQDILSPLVAKRLAEAEEASGILQAWTALVQLDGRLSREAGDYNRARALFERVLPRIPQPGKPGIEFQLARIDIESGEAERGYRRLGALAPLFTGLYAPRLGVLMSWQGEALLRMGRVIEALDLARAGAEALMARGDLDSMWSAQWRVARCLLALGRRREAYKWACDAADTIRELRRAPLGHRLDSTYLADKLPVLDQAIDLAVEFEDAPAACRLIEGVKSRGLTAILRTTQTGPPDERSSSGEFEQLTRVLARLEHAATREGWTLQMKAAQQKLLAERAALIERIRITEPRWRAVTEMPGFDLAELQATLAAADCAALTLYHRGDRLVAVLITGKACRAAERTLHSETLQSLERYRLNLRSQDPRVEWFDPSSLPGLDAEDLLPGSLLDEALATRRAVIVPHGALHVLPWATLRRGTRRLFTFTPITVAPNLSCLLLLRRREEPARRVALIGAPEYGDRSSLRELTLAPTELRAVESRYRTRGNGVLGEIIEGKDAVRDAFRSHACRTDARGAVLHVVCHGDFVTGEPLNSGLLMTDGKVDAAEISRYRILYDEVVLSACSTGYRPTAVGDIELTGDDLVGLVAAFLEAGARAVLVSIPPAREDAAQRFMSAYHARRADGASAHDALRGAQQTMLDQGVYDAALWAGYTLYGG